MSHEQFQSCIDACNQCATACDHCAVSCLAKSSVQAMVRCIELDLDCAQVCRFAAGVMARGSQYAPETCELCANICEDCGEECAKHEVEHCQACAEACRCCAQECRRMAMEGTSQRTRKSETRTAAH